MCWLKQEVLDQLHVGGRGQARDAMLQNVKEPLLIEGPKYWTILLLNAKCVEQQQVRFE